MDGASFALGFAWQPSASCSFASAVATISSRCISSAVYGNDKLGKSDDEFYGFVDVSNSSATSILAEITESNIDASEAEGSRNDSDSLPPYSDSDSVESVTEEQPVWDTQLHDVTIRQCV